MLGLLGMPGRSCHAYLQLPPVARPYHGSYVYKLIMQIQGLKSQGDHLGCAETALGR
jgi:hypothetical protein